MRSAPLCLLALCLVAGCAPRVIAPRAAHYVPGDLLADEAQRSSALQHYEEAQALLAQPKSGASLQAAFDALKASCREGHPPACSLLNAQVKPGAIAAPPPPRRTPEAYRAGAGGWVRVTCRHLTDGRMGQCQAEEDMGYGMAAAAMQELEAIRGQPTLFSGQPIVSEYTYDFYVEGPGTPQQQLEWARAQVLEHPGSGPAWHNFATLMERYQPGHAALKEVLTRAVQLQPEHPRLLNSLAWAHVEAKQYVEAYPLAVRLLRTTHNRAEYFDTFAAAAAGSGHCEQAIAAQRRAIELLALSGRTVGRASYEQRLSDYTQRCAARAAAPQP